MKYKGDWSFLGHPLNWAADGQGIFVSTEAARGRSILMHMDLQGNLRPLWNTASYFTWGVPSPDGRRLAIAASMGESNVWMLENF